jgi:amidase
MKTISSDKIIYAFDPKHEPIAHVKTGELLTIETQDAFGGQIKSERDSVETLDWSKVDGATGPIFIEDAMPGDTLVTEIINIKIPKKGVIVTVPKYGILAEEKVKPLTKIITIQEDYVEFEKIRLKTRPMIGTIGVTPRRKIPCGSLGRHGGNMDVKELTAGTRLFLPIFVEGALFGAGDVHAVQADGELCVSAVEVPSEISLKFTLVKGRHPEWPTLEMKDSYGFLACGKTLDEAAEHATKTAVEALMREHDWSFEKAYMFSSLGVDLEINQVVDPKKGVRAVISKDHLGLNGILFSPNCLEKPLNRVKNDSVQKHL